MPSSQVRRPIRRIVFLFGVLSSIEVAGDSFRSGRDLLASIMTTKIQKIPPYADSRYSTGLPSAAGEERRQHGREGDEGEEGEEEEDEEEKEEENEEEEEEKQ